MTTTAGIGFVAIIVVFVAAVLVYRWRRVGSFARALAALGGRATRPGPLPDALAWTGTEIVAARAFEIVPGVPATFVALLRSPAPAASADLGTAAFDPFLALRLPGEAIRDRDTLRAAVASQARLEDIYEDETGQVLVAVRALHTGASVAGFVAAVRAAL